MSKSKTFIKIISLGTLFTLAFIVSTFLYTSTIKKELVRSKAAQEKMLADYASTLKTKTDAYILTVNGLRQLNKNLPDLALVTLERAVEIDKGYRDSWLALGLAQIQNTDYKGALNSFQEAEKIDPINAKTYQYLALVYEKLEQKDSAKQAQAKYDFLVKK